MADPWRNCLASLTLLEWVNARWPRRDKTSDGTIGDAAHATRTSDHNPWVKVAGWGVVRARDVDVDGIDAAWMVERLRQLGADGDRRLAGGGYVIFNRRITKKDFSGWAKYTGSNPHDHHFHVSFSLNKAGFDSSADWSALGATGGLGSPITTLPVPPVPEDDMFENEDRVLLRRLAQAVMVDVTTERVVPLPNRIMDAQIGGAGGGQALWANVSQIRADLGAIAVALAANPVQANGLTREELTAAVADAIPADIAEDVARHLGAKLAA